MLKQLDTEKAVLEILWQSLEGGHYNLQELKTSLRVDSRIDEIGVDSLELVDFYLRLQDHFKIKIQQEDFDKLTSVGAVQAYIERERSAPGGENSIC
jgi:acyl carrier protein